jgi:transcriptional antiterminator NusG
MTVEDVRERDTASTPAEDPSEENPEETTDRATPEPADQQAEEPAEDAEDAPAEAEEAPEPEEVAPPVAPPMEPVEASADVAEPEPETETETIDPEAGVKEALAGEPKAEEAKAEPQPEEAPVEEPQAEPAQAEEPQPEDVGPPEPAVAAESVDGSAPTPAPEAPAEAAPAAEAPAEVAVEGEDPFGGPGDWYVVHTYAGYENKVKTNLESRIKTMQMQDKIFDVVIPMEDVMEIKSGRKQVVQKKVFPGYLLVKMSYDDDSWYVVRNTPGVTGFVSSGTGQKPTPLSRGEVEKILTVKEEEAKKPAFRLDFEEGDVVRIISGPFADFNGTISDINVDQSKVRVMVNIFDRETPVELSFDQVARV